MTANVCGLLIVLSFQSAPRTLESLQEEVDNMLGNPSESSNLSLIAAEGDFEVTNSEIARLAFALNTLNDLDEQGLSPLTPISVLINKYTEGLLFNILNHVPDCAVLWCWFAVLMLLTYHNTVIL